MQSMIDVLDALKHDPETTLRLQVGDDGIDIPNGEALRLFGETRKPVTVLDIVQVAAAFCGVQASDVLGCTRTRDVVMARAIVCVLSLELTSLSRPQIARQLLRPSHSLVVDARKKHRRRMATEEAYSRAYVYCRDAVVRQTIIGSAAQ